MRELLLKVLQHGYREVGFSTPAAEATALSSLKTFEAGALKEWSHDHCRHCAHEMLKCPYLPGDNPAVVSLHVANIVYRTPDGCPEFEASEGG